MFLMQYAKDFAKRTSGCPGMGPSRKRANVDSRHENGGSSRCLFCGKTGHRATSGVHASELAEGNASYSQSQLQRALSEVSNESSLSNDQKRTWVTRIKAYFSKMKDEGTRNVAEATL